MLGGEKREGVSPFRAVTLALAGTLGVGNIAGVAGAIALGGFGAIFWMWASALCAMVLKYAEITLAVAHRREKNGERFGGAPYYIRDFFEKLGLSGAGRVIAALFAVLCFVEVLSTGCGIQINAAAGAVESATGIPAAAVGIFAAALTLYAVFGGAERVSRITVKLIPALSAAYVLLSLSVLIIKRGELFGVFSAILSDAFAIDSMAGGIFGFLFCRAVRYGAMRGLLSNEAGCGTAPLAHASSNTESPAEQGFWGIFEVFFDTIVLCTMTAAVIIISYEDALPFASEPIKMAVAAYSAVLGDWSGYFLSFAVAAFGISTVLCCAHYARECAFFLFGRRSRLISGVCLTLYCAAAVVGSFVASDILWQISDLSLALMTLINVTVLLCMSREVKSITESYFDGG